MIDTRLDHAAYSLGTAFSQQADYRQALQQGHGLEIRCAGVRDQNIGGKFTQGLQSCLRRLRWLGLQHGSQGNPLQGADPQQQRLSFIG